MPITNAKSREFALKHCYARSVHAFSQQGPNCTAYVAMWLRKRSRDKPFFSAADYFRVTEKADGVTRFVESKADVVIAKLLPGNKVEVPQNMTKGAEKSEALQVLMKGDSKFERTYIMSGSKHQTTSLAFVDRRKNQRISAKRWDGKGMRDLIVELGKKKLMASLGIFTKVPHALGIDCSAKYPAYFDPNLGELTFANADWMGYWWKMCYSDDRSEAPATNVLSAWRDMCDTVFSADIYQRI